LLIVLLVLIFPPVYAWGNANRFHQHWKLLSQLTQPGVQTVPKPVAKQVHRQHSCHYGQSRHGGNPPSYCQPVSPVRHHRSPRWRWRRHAGSEEAERGFQQDHDPDLQRRQHTEGVDHAGENVNEQDALRSRPGHPGHGHEVHCFQLEHLA